MIAAFGKRARRWAAGAQVDDNVIAADETGLIAAVVEAVRRRTRGKTFAVALFLEEDPNRFARAWSAKIVHGAADFDARRAACGAIAAGTVIVDGKRQIELGAVPRDTLEYARMLWGLGDRAVIVSENANLRLSMLFGRLHAERIVPASQSDREVPAPSGPHEAADHIVVWAGTRSADEIAVVLCALEELHTPVYVVCKGGKVPTTIHRCTLEQAEPLLRSAAAIVDTNNDFPGTALALARFGAPLAIARTSHAFEFLDGAIGHDGWNRDTVLDAVLKAMGSGPPIPTPSAVAPPKAKRRSRASVRERAPLVTAITPTYNRRLFLPRALGSVKGQTYPNVEHLVVNDGGEAIGDIVESFGARTIDLARNVRHGAALNAGIAQAKGEYLAFLDDDDIWFPDHLAALVDGVQRAKGAIAHSNAMVAHRGDFDEIVGFSPGALAGVDTEEILVVCPFLGMIATLIHRDALAAVGDFDEPLTPNEDYEMILRLGLRYDWVHVDRITCLWSHGGNYTHVSDATGSIYPSLYEEAYRRHPEPDRPLLALRRRQFVEGLRNANGLTLNLLATRLERPVILS